VLDWSVNETAAGTWQIARNISYVKVFQASHMVGFDLPDVAHDMILRFMGVDFSVLSEGSVGRIESSLGESSKEAILPGGGRIGDLERAKWEGMSFFTWSNSVEADVDPFSVLQRRHSGTHCRLDCRRDRDVPLLPFKTKCTNKVK